MNYQPCVSKYFKGLKISTCIVTTAVACDMFETAFKQFRYILIYTQFGLKLKFVDIDNILLVEGRASLPRFTLKVSNIIVNVGLLDK